jgi:hypothetical protein
LLFQEPQGDLLAFRDLASRNQRRLSPTMGELDHRAHRVFQLLRDLQHRVRPLRASLGWVCGCVNALTCDDAASRNSPVPGIHIIPLSVDNPME